MKPTPHTSKTPDQRDQSGPQPTLLLFGGSGGLTTRYREIAAARGFALRHCEDRVPSSWLVGQAAQARKIALVVIMVSMVSHPLRDQAQRIANKGHAPIVYLRSASVSALQKALMTPAITAQGEDSYVSRKK